MGWVDSEQVIPEDGAIEFFTKQIKADPWDALPIAMCGCCVMTSTTPMRLA